MLSAWTKHLRDPKETERFQQALRSAKPVLERLQEIMDEEVQRLDRSETNPATYENGGWPFLQAHKNGFRQYHQLITKLTNFDQKEQ